MSEKIPVGVIVKVKDGVFLHPQAEEWHIDDITSVLSILDVNGDSIIEYRSYDSVYTPNTKIEQLLQEAEATKPGEFDDIVETRDIPHGLVPDGFIVHAVYQKNLIIKRKGKHKPAENNEPVPESKGEAE